MNTQDPYENLYLHFILRSIKWNEKPQNKKFYIQNTETKFAVSCITIETIKSLIDRKQ